MKKMAKFAAAALGSVALLGAVQGTAQAATTTETVPSCVKLDAPYNMFGGIVKATVTNGCTQSVKVKIVFPSGPGDKCHSLAPQQSVVEEYWSMGFGQVAKGLLPC
ncbi:hypothetical protein AB0F13_00075 [Streptomyces sp. NPDC026206]|uniref:hypothetical protein n=1 Tax=Streptomyces sp. NPDC026206 TaxID=3157089 RepID=UPI0033EAA75A